MSYTEYSYQISQKAEELVAQRGLGKLATLPPKEQLEYFSEAERVYWERG